MQPGPSTPLRHPLGFPRLTLLLLLLGLLGWSAGCATIGARLGKKPPVPLRTVRHVDLARYMGDWHVIADIPDAGDKDRVDSIESYALRPDGKIETWFTYRKKSFDAPQKTVHAQATVVNQETNAEWRVISFGPLGRESFIIDLDPNYQWAVAGDPSRNHGWIMAREKTLPPAAYEAILDRIAVQGYDPGRFVKVPQLAGTAGGFR